MFDWEWVIPVAIGVIVLGMALILGIFAYKGQLVGANQSAAAATRDWLIAFTGPITILAALIAAVPVFEQLDETRYTSIALRIDVLRHTLETIDKEAATVFHIRKFLHSLPAQPTPEQKTHFCKDDDEWGNISNTKIGFRTTPDRSEEITSQRQAASAKLDTILSYKDRYCSGNDNALGAFQQNMNDLDPLIANYEQGYHIYTRIRVAELLILQKRLKYDLDTARAEAHLEIPN